MNHALIVYRVFHLHTTLDLGHRKFKCHQNFMVAELTAEFTREIKKLR